LTGPSFGGARCRVSVDKSGLIDRLTEVKRVARSNVDGTSAYVIILAWSARHWQVLVVYLEIDLLRLILVVDQFGKGIEGVLWVKPETAFELLVLAIEVTTAGVFALTNEYRKGRKDWASVSGLYSTSRQPYEHDCCQKDL
jgi:hypothetical protein